MSRDPSGVANVERRLQSLLEESVQRVGGRARSRLNQARHAALAEAGRSGSWHEGVRPAAPLRRHPLLCMSAVGGVAAAVLVAFVLWPHVPRSYPAAAPSRAAAEDLDLLADRDAMALMRNGDGQFYEWAMAQAGDASPPADAGAAPRAKTHGRRDEADSSRNNG